MLSVIAVYKFYVELDSGHFSGVVGSRISDVGESLTWVLVAAILRALRALRSFKANNKQDTMIYMLEEPLAKTQAPFEF